MTRYYNCRHDTGPLIISIVLFRFVSGVVYERWISIIGRIHESWHETGTLVQREKGRGMYCHKTVNYQRTCRTRTILEAMENVLRTVWFLLIPIIRNVFFQTPILNPGKYFLFTRCILSIITQVQEFYSRYT